MNADCMSAVETGLTVYLFRITPPYLAKLLSVSSLTKSNSISEGPAYLHNSQCC